MLCAFAAATVALVPQLPAHRVTGYASGISRTSDVQMINLFGNTDESAKQRSDLSLRNAPPGSRVVAFRKENAATQGLQLGLKFRESFGKAVYIDAILPGSQAARLEKQGKLRKGDEVVMVSATFGDEMWSARGIGKQRLEKSIAVRQGMTISLVLENPKDLDKRKLDFFAAKKEKERMARMQKQLQDEVNQEKK